MIHMICINHPAAQNVPRDDKMLRLSGHWCSPRKTEKQLPSLLQGKKRPRSLRSSARPLFKFLHSHETDSIEQFGSKKNWQLRR